MFSRQYLPLQVLSLLLSTALSLSLVQSVQAEPKRSLLFSVGQAKQSIGDISGRLQALGYSGVSITDDPQDSSLALGLRYPIISRWSADVQYLQQGRAHPDITATVPLGKTQAQAANDAANDLPERGDGLSMIALYHLPVGIQQAHTLQLGVGAFVWRSKRVATIGAERHEENDKGVSLIAQLGVSYPLNGRIRLEAQWQHTFMPEEDVDRLALGLVIGF